MGKHKLERTCIGCMIKKSKNDFLRILRKPDGKIVLDHTKTGDGRGAYVCFDVNCILKAQKSRKLSRALKCDVNEDIYNVVLKYIEEHKNGGI